MEELCSRLKDLQSQQGESAVPVGCPRPPRRAQVSEPIGKREHGTAVFVPSVSPSRCPAPSLAVEGCWSAHGHPLQRGPWSQRSGFICRSTPGEEMKLWIWSNHLLSFHPPPAPPPPKFLSAIRLQNERPHPLQPQVLSDFGFSPCLELPSESPI